MKISVLTSSTHIPVSSCADGAVVRVESEYFLVLKSTNSSSPTKWLVNLHTGVLLDVAPNQRVEVPSLAELTVKF